jgi:hypothetical protein
LNGGPYSSAMTAWRDSKVRQGVFSCGTPPSWYPLNQARVVVFDEQEHAVQLSPTTFPFPAEVGKVAVGSANLPTPFNFGWILFDLNATTGSAPPEDTLAEQAWMTLSSDFQTGTGRISVAYPAFQLDTARDRVRGCRTNVFFKSGQ